MEDSKESREDGSSVFVELAIFIGINFLVCALYTIYYLLSNMTILREAEFMAFFIPFLIFGRIFIFSTVALVGSVLFASIFREKKYFVVPLIFTIAELVFLLTNRDISQFSIPIFLTVLIFSLYYGNKVLPKKNLRNLGFPVLVIICFTVVSFFVSFRPSICKSACLDPNKNYRESLNIESILPQSSLSDYPISYNYSVDLRPMAFFSYETDQNPVTVRTGTESWQYYDTNVSTNQSITVIADKSVDLPSGIKITVDGTEVVQSNCINHYDYCDLMWLKGPYRFKVSGRFFASESSEYGAAYTDEINKAFGNMIEFEKHVASIMISNTKDLK